MTARFPLLLLIVALAGCGSELGDWSHDEVDVTDRFEVTEWSDASYEATDMAFLPDGRALLITKGGWQGPGVGTVELIGADGRHISTVLELPVCSDAERGLLGIAIDPAFEETSRIFLFHTRQMSDCAVTGPDITDPDDPVFDRVSSFVFSEQGIDPASEAVIVDDLPSFRSSHNAGGLEFMEDGTLLIAVGEAGMDRSRDVTSPNGKLLRVDVDHPEQPPEGNPFDADSGAAPFVYASGLRNPFRIADSSDSSVVIAADVGTEEFEEINVIEPGADYGFPTVEGPKFEGLSRRPALWYKHVDGCNAVIGGDFVSSGFIGAAATEDQPLDWLTFSDLGCPAVWAAGISDGEVVELLRIADALPQSLAHLVTGPDDSLYLVGIGPGPAPVRRLAPHAP